MRRFGSIPPYGRKPLVNKSGDYHDDPWEVILDEAFNHELTGPLKNIITGTDRFTINLPWLVLNIPPERQTESQRDRINAAMQSIGFEKKRARGQSDDDKDVKHRWCRIEHDPDEIVRDMTEDEDGDAGSKG